MPIAICLHCAMFLSVFFRCSFFIFIVQIDFQLSRISCFFPVPRSMPMQVNEDIRKKMFALRQTWNDVFPPPKLYTLDVKVNQIDPHWPISAQKISPAIHVNPNFFSTTVRPLNTYKTLFNAVESRPTV